MYKDIEKFDRWVRKSCFQIGVFKNNKKMKKEKHESDDADGKFSDGKFRISEEILCGYTLRKKG